MKSNYMPEHYFKSIYSIDFCKLKAAGINNLIIDIDNTLMRWGSRTADEKVINFIKELKALGFKICLLSNSSRGRVKRFKGDLDVEFFAMGIKPMRIMFMGALKKIGGRPQNTCVIGDQIFTDILGGNRCRLHTILVDPVSSEEFITTKLIRKIECRIKRELKYEKTLTKSE